MSDQVRFERHDGIADIVLDRPAEGDLISAAMGEAMIAQLGSAGPDVKLLWTTVTEKIVTCSATTLQATKDFLRYAARMEPDAAMALSANLNAVVGSSRNAP